MENMENIERFNQKFVDNNNILISLDLRMLADTNLSLEEKGFLASCFACQQIQTNSRGEVERKKLVDLLGNDSFGRPNLYNFLDEISWATEQNIKIVDSLIKKRYCKKEEEAKEYFNGEKNGYEIKTNTTYVFSQVPIEKFDDDKKYFCISNLINKLSDLDTEKLIAFFEIAEKEEQNE